MQDQVIMENILVSVKNACDLFLHGTIESSTENVLGSFKQALNDSLCIQNEVYSKMSQKGWYTTTQADANQINQVKPKFQNA